jgi:hypothetical protein
MIMMTAPATFDPKNPATKPHGTTDDQAKEMESEGQAKTTQDTPDGTPVRSSLDKTMSDQDIDTAGTDADKA